MKLFFKFALSCVVLAGFLILSAGSASDKSILASYDVGLKDVESPANAKVQFGENKVVNFYDKDQTKYKYEDDYIEIVWYVGFSSFHFELKNKTTHPLKINWDDISYVNINGQTGRVMHAGVKYAERNSSQPSTTIPKGANLSDVLIPTDNVYYINPTKYTSGSWNEGQLIPNRYTNQNSFDTDSPSYVGKQLIILMPILIENVQNDYTFTFSIDKVNQITKKK